MHKAFAKEPPAARMPITMVNGAAQLDIIRLKAVEEMQANMPGRQYERKAPCATRASGSSTCYGSVPSRWPEARCNGLWKKIKEISKSITARRMKK